MEIRYFAAVISVLLAAASAQSKQEILIFGGSGHKDFLGCLSCGEMESNSVWNELSRYGFHNRFATWSHFGNYASPYSGQSACNEYASDPPILVDQYGNYYSRLSVNQYIKDSVCGITGVEKLCVALRVMCAEE
jgi:hypothetical protein